MNMVYVGALHPAQVWHKSQSHHVAIRALKLLYSDIMKAGSVLNWKKEASSTLFPEEEVAEIK